MRITPAALLAAISILVAAACTSPGHVAAVRMPATKLAAANVGAGWTTYHHDNSRTGYDPTAPAIVNTAPVSQWHNGVDSNVYAEPLVWNGMVIIATEN